MGETLSFARLNFDVEKPQYKDIKELKAHRKNILSKLINYDTDLYKIFLKAKSKQIFNNFIWEFGGIIVKDNYIFGKLGKRKKQSRVIRDSSTRDFKQISEVGYNVSRFIIDLERNVFCYEVKKNVGQKSPIEILETAFNIFYFDKEGLKIERISDPRGILKRIKKLSVLSSLELSLHKSNPHSSPISLNMDKFMEVGGIENLNLKANSKHKNIKLDNVPLIKSGVALAEEGYGSVKAIGRKGRERVDLSSGKIPYKKRTKLHKYDEDTINILLYHIKEMEKEINEKYEDT